MSDSGPYDQPQRSADIARLNLTKLRIEDGIALQEVFRQVTETSSTTLNVERVGVWLLVDQRRALRCVELFENSKATHSVGLTLQASDFPDYFSALEQRKTVPAEVAASDPRTSGLGDVYLAPLGITSMLDAPIFVGGEVIGVVCHEHVGPPREWTTEERDFAGSIADIVALKIRAAELEDAKVALRMQANQLSEVRRLDSLAEMAAGVAHDFKNILHVINVGARLILQAQTSAEVAEYARQISEAGDQGMSLAKELMGFARPGPRSSRVIRPAEVISAQLTLLQNAAGEQHPIYLDSKSAFGRVLIAPDQIDRLMLNLVMNARDAMPDGGAIRVALESVDELGEDNKRGRYFLIEVSDHGTGILPSVLPRIFDPFYTSKPRGQGTGLGLAVVNQIVSYAGGFIRIETVVGKGSSFRVYLPLASSQ